MVSSRLIGLLHERWGRKGFRPFMLQEFRRLSLDSTQLLGEIFGAVILFTNLSQPVVQTRQQ